MTKSLITGITGQAGSYLAEILLNLGHHVYGIVRRTSTINTSRIDHLRSHERLHLVYGDITDGTRMLSMFNEHRFDRAYHLAAQSHVAVSFDNPTWTLENNIRATANMLECVRMFRDCRLYHSSSSEMFGDQPGALNEENTFAPKSPYAVSKVASHQLCQMYRNAYGLQIWNGITFNMESPRRDPRFVTRKVTMAAARISLGLQKRLVLGDLSSSRDWGFARDYMTAASLMLSGSSKPTDYVLATGQTHTVSELCATAFEAAGVKDWMSHVESSPQYIRPNDLHRLLGNPLKIQMELGWTPVVRFHELIRMMVEHDIQTAKNGDIQ